MKLQILMMAALGLGALAQAQSSPEPLLRGTTFNLPWGLYAGGLTTLTEGEARLRLSAPADAKVLGTRYDEGSRRALITYRSPLSADAAMDFATGQLRRQGFEQTYRARVGSGQSRALLRLSLIHI